MKYYFRTEKMSVGYHKQPLIEHMEIGLEKGEILTLIGPNGAGKSTVLKSIAGQLRLLAGAVYLDGQDLEKLSARQLSQNMAVVLTKRLRTEMMTCEDVVATGRYPYTGRFGLLSEEDRRIVQEAMELVHVSELAGQDFQKSSDGQKQRVMLARAICQEPEIILLDEPTSYLDIRHKLEFLSVLQEMKRRKGLTVIMSLHELELAERISDKILCLNGAYAERYGTPEEIFRSGYIRKLYGITAGSFDEENGNLELAPASGKPEVFVLAGGGNGRRIYRRLQRENRAFVTGILYENDLDYPAAQALAAEVITAKAFEPISQEVFVQAKKAIDRCSKVICARKDFGSFEKANEELLAYAEKQGKEIYRMKNEQRKKENDSERNE